MEDRGRNDVLLIVGIVVLVIGLGAFANALGLVPPLAWDALRLAGRATGPLALILLGAIVIMLAGRGGVHVTLPGPGVKLYRSRTNRKISGVAGGIGEYVGVDPTIVRLLFVLLAFASAGTALLLYILLAVLMPEAPAQASHLGYPEAPVQPAAQTVPAPAPAPSAGPGEAPSGPEAPTQPMPPTPPEGGSPDA